MELTIKWTTRSSGLRADGSPTYALDGIATGDGLRSERVQFVGKRNPFRYDLTFLPAIDPENPWAFGGTPVVVNGVDLGTAGVSYVPATEWPDADLTAAEREDNGVYRAFVSLAPNDQRVSAIVNSPLAPAAPPVAPPVASAVAEAGLSPITVTLEYEREPYTRERDGRKFGAKWSVRIDPFPVALHDLETSWGPLTAWMGFSGLPSRDRARDYAAAVVRAIAGTGHRVSLDIDESPDPEELARHQQRFA